MNKLEIRNQETGSIKTAVSFVPEAEGELAIVHLSTIQKLAELLPSANFNTIKDNIIVKMRRCDCLNEIVELMENEVAFHTTMNLIKLYKPESTPFDKPEVVGKIDL